MVRGNADFQSGFQLLQRDIFDLALGSANEADLYFSTGAVGSAAERDKDSVPARCFLPELRSDALTVMRRLPDGNVRGIGFAIIATRARERVRAPNAVDAIAAESKGDVLVDRRRLAQVPVNFQLCAYILGCIWTLPPL